MSSKDKKLSQLIVYADMMEIRDEVMKYVEVLVWLVKALPLNEADVQRIIEEICNIPLEDNVRFQIKSTRTIMEEFDYPGIRVMLEATLDKMFYTMHFLPPVKSGKLFLARIILKLHYIWYLTICKWQSFGRSFRKAIFT